MINGKRLLQFYILWTTNKEPKCGYDIMKELEDFFIIKGVSQAVIYLNLRGLESKDVLKGTKGSRNKTIYSLTKRGEDLLLEETKMMREYILKFKDIINYVMDREDGVVG
ncbi:MAG TPA: PadR family transcriptional regulator [Candidatus Methanofastidiosa archaeon]|nr:PadR family transcriptional regulator [Candidatus Methanofastidiosa archaeon]HPR41174.1 PadR family transcriptional regulator [Candidatus Methanofastidiosa archaeon]